MTGQNRRQDGTSGPGERWRTSADRRRNHTFSGLLIRVLGVRFPRRSPQPYALFSPASHSRNCERVCTMYRVAKGPVSGAEVPALPGCPTSATNEAVGRMNAREAIEGYLQDADGSCSVSAILG